MNSSRTALLIIAGSALITSAYATPDIEVAPPGVDFGHDELCPASCTTAWLVTVYNRGDSDLELGEFAGMDPLEFPFELSASECSQATLAPGERCNFSVSFHDQPVGDFDAAFDIPSNDPDQPELTFPVSARVAEVPFSGDLDGIAAPALLICRNVTTGQTARVPLQDTTVWDCPEAGLDVSSGDEVQVFIAGIAEGNTFPPPGEPDFAAEVLADAPSEGLTVEVRPESAFFGRHPVVLGDRTIQFAIRHFSNEAPVVAEVANTDRLNLPFFLRFDSCTGEVLDLPRYCVFDVVFRPQDGEFTDTFSVTVEGSETVEFTLNVAGRGAADVLASTIYGVGAREFTCINLTTGQSTGAFQGPWDCGAAGLSASQGDLVVIGVTGTR